MKIKQDDLGIGDNLRRLRKSVKLTQDQVAAQLTTRGLPIDRSVYAHMERGCYNIKVAELIALKEIFQIDTFDEFFHGLALKKIKDGES